MGLVYPSDGRHEAFPLHLVRLVSQSLPVGGFSYSRGLESAVQAGWVSDEASAQDWILGLLQSSFAPLDGALFCRMTSALAAGDSNGFLAANAWLMAGRESREFQQEDRRMGARLLSLLVDLEVPSALANQTARLSFCAAFALAADHWNISQVAALRGLMWVLVEGQVMAAIRLVPIGHTVGQRILISAVDAIDMASGMARSIGDDEIGNLAPALAMASAWHETQYSRLFQS